MLMVILGAGASHDSYGSLAAGNPGGGALSPEEHRPPLTKDLFEEGPSVNSTTRLVPECAGWVGHMRRLIRQLDKEKVQSVEEILAHLAASPDPNLSKRATLAIRLFMQHMLTECQHQWANVITSNVTNYGTLLADIAVAGITGACFVSFNYDTLFEQALPTIGVTIDSLESYITHPAYKVVKPHGSLNWSHELPRQGIVDLSGQPAKVARWLIAYAPEVSPSPAFTFFAKPVFALRPDTNPPDVLWPALALPIARKADFECPEPHMNAPDTCISSSLASFLGRLARSWSDVTARTQRR